MDIAAHPCAGCCFMLRFAAASPQGHDYTFPCDERGQVDLDTLPERLRCDYFFARGMVGRALALPVVVPVPAPAPALPGAVAAAG
ncbi:MAG: hypothetical protein HY855_21405 [Burkholderiales bacterium]|nr:hypothetical protein [Burkholderiales bacterium]